MTLADDFKKEHVVILISADAEWRGIKKLFPNSVFTSSPFGEWFVSDLTEPVYGEHRKNQAIQSPIVFLHGGWGKISAAASTQYSLDRWRPALLINLGTCGGFAGAIQVGDILLVEKTIVYDIIEQMGDFEAHIRHYSTDIDLDWLSEPFPIQVVRKLIVSGDRDLLPQDIPELIRKYGAAAGDWESGAIAFVAARNGVRTLILRGVTDLVGISGSPAYGNLELFEQQAFEILKILVRSLPVWLERSGLM